MKQVEVAITGGGGFIGACLVRRLVEGGRAVRVLEVPGRPIDHLPTEGCEIHRGDVGERRDVERFVAEADWVVNLAANPNLWASDAEEFHRVNHLGARHVIESAAATGASRIVQVSTEAILARRRPEMITERTRAGYAEMVGPYCRSKWRAEAEAWRAAEAGAPVMVVSPAVPVGAGDWLQGPLTRLLVDFGQGRIKALLEADLPLIAVDDAAGGIEAALARGEPGQRYLLAAENWTTRRLFDALANLTGRPAPRARVPYALALSFAWAEQAYCEAVNGRTPMASVAGVRLARRYMRFDTTRTREALGLEFRPVRDALAEAVGWLAARGELPAEAARRVEAG